MNTKVIKQKNQAELKLDAKIIQKQELKSKGLFYAAMGVLGIILVGIGVYLFWTLQTGTVLEVKNSPVPVRPTTIDTDQYILLRYDYCKYTDAEGTVESQLVSNTSSIPLPDAIDRTKSTCKVFDAPYPVPGQTPPETYRYHFKACYPINPIKTVCTEWESQEFEIKGPKPQLNIEIPKK